MQKNTFSRAGYSLFLFLLLYVKAFAQTPTRLGPASKEEISKAFAVVEAHMDSTKAHRNYIFAMGLINPDLWTQYEIWMKKYPDNIKIPLAIGSVYFKAQMPQPKDFLLKAAAMDPNRAEIWHMLAEDAYLKAQTDMVSEYLKKASLAEPSNVGYAYGYFRCLEHSNPEEYRKSVFDFAKRFPTDDRGALAIYELSRRTTNLKEKVKYLEELRTLYPPQKFKWSASGMMELTDAYLQTDVAKALVLIKEMSTANDGELRKQVAESLMEIEKLEQDRKYKEALVKLNEVKLPRSNYIDDFIALKKASLQEKAGNVIGAYDSLSVKFAKLPTDALHDALETYGMKIGKGKGDVDKDIEMIRNGSATRAYPFDLAHYSSNEKLNLNDLKGKVVLLTFWFPGCAPCREEFPHFQTVVDSFKGDSLMYVGINVIPSQDGYVLPFMKNSKYSFIPLRGSWKFAEQNFGVQRAPENFLIDKDGKIVFKDFRIDNSNHRTLELMISSLLEKGSTKQ